MNKEQALKIFAELGIPPSEALYALEDFRRARTNFAEEEYTTKEHTRRLEAAYTLLRTK